MRAVPLFSQFAVRIPPSRKLKPEPAKTTADPFQLPLLVLVLAQVLPNEPAALVQRPASAVSHYSHRSYLAVE